MPKTRFQYRHQYDDEADRREREATDIDIVEPSLTQQHYKDEVDLNIMMARMGVSDGAIPPAALDPSYFGDFTDATDLRTAIDRTREAEQRFMELPAEIRRRFDNDPAELLAFVMNEKNADEAVKMGLLSRFSPMVAGGEPTPPTPQGEKTPEA